MKLFVFSLELQRSCFYKVGGLKNIKNVGKNIVKKFRKKLAIATGTIAITLLPLQALAKDYSALNIFGDSLVDAGNLFNLTGLPPSPPYDQKLSNGPVWVEQLAVELDLEPVLVTEAIPNLLRGKVPTEGINFALTGSLSSDVNVVSPLLPGLQQQIETFGGLATFIPPKSDALFVLLAGGNDYNEAIFRPSSIDSAALPNQVTDNLTNAVAALIGSGAKQLLVSNLPNLGQQPFADFLDQVNPQSSALLTSFSTQHNLLLDQKLTALETASGAHITQLDLDSLFASAISNPGEFGFTNVDDACLTNFQPGFMFEGVCTNPDEFLFWDNVHPTTQAHGLIAQLALKTLHTPEIGEDTQSVPEPSGIVGLLALGGGAILRRRGFAIAAYRSRSKSRNQAM